MDDNDLDPESGYEDKLDPQLAECFEKITRLRAPDVWEEFAIETDRSSAGGQRERHLLLSAAAAVVLVMAGVAAAVWFAAERRDAVTVAGDTVVGDTVCRRHRCRRHRAGRQSWR